MSDAKIKCISQYFPETILTNEELCVGNTNWTPEKIYIKTGIKERRISALNETAVDLGVGAANALFSQFPDEREKVDYIIFCTQTPDYCLPSSSCILQNKLNLKKSIGAIDINQGCSGYVYGLSLAKGLIAGGLSKNILLITSDTYTKLINENDYSIRTLFGDGATATIITSANTNNGIGEFIFGTDGSGYDKLIVPASGFRLPKSAKTKIQNLDYMGNIRTQEQLFMDGGAILTFGLKVVPNMIQQLLEKSGLELDDINHFIFHQASLFMLDKLVSKLKIPPEKVPIFLENYGNTVSSSIPLVLKEYINNNTITEGDKVFLLGFGVGLSWAACEITI